MLCPGMIFLGMIFLSMKTTAACLHAAVLHERHANAARGPTQTLREPERNRLGVAPAERRISRRSAVASS